jgi:hypothetical protein
VGEAAVLAGEAEDFGFQIGGGGHWEMGEILKLRNLEM